MKLTVELVPQTCFFSNLRSNLSKKNWDMLRQQCYFRANYRCEICHSAGNGRSLECHEIWHYDDETHVQSLAGLVALCRDCHRVKHMALARKMGWQYQAEEHLAEINNWNQIQVSRYLDEVFDVFEQRSQHDWKLDISWLAGMGVTLPDMLDRDAPQQGL